MCDSNTRPKARRSNQHQLNSWRRPSVAGWYKVPGSYTGGMSSAGAREGCQIILVNKVGAVLLQLRDNKPTIAFPNMWVIPGGMLDPDETAAACIAREVREELGVTLPAESIEFLGRTRRSYGVENTFTAPLDAASTSIILTEGQRITWFTEPDIRAMELAYEDNAVLADYFCRQSTR